MDVSTAILRQRRRSLSERIRTLASWLLVLCFALPLSYCASKGDVNGAPAAKAITWTGLGIATDAVRDIGVGDADSVLLGAVKRWHRGERTTA